MLQCRNVHHPSIRPSMLRATTIIEIGRQKAEGEHNIEQYNYNTYGTYA